MWDIQCTLLGGCPQAPPSTEKPGKQFLPNYLSPCSNVNTELKKQLCDWEGGSITSQTNHTIYSVEVCHFLASLNKGLRRQPPLNNFSVPSYFHLWLSVTGSNMYKHMIYQKLKRDHMEDLSNPILARQARMWLLCCEYWAGLKREGFFVLCFVLVCNRPSKKFCYVLVCDILAKNPGDKGAQNNTNRIIRHATKYFFSWHWMQLWHHQWLWCQWY